MSTSSSIAHASFDTFCAICLSFSVTVFTMTLPHRYLRSLVDNPLIHTDSRCAEIVSKFLDTNCDFKEEMKKAGKGNSGRKPISSMLNKRDKDWKSFTTLFNVTEEDVEEQYSAAYVIFSRFYTRICNCALSLSVPF